MTILAVVLALAVCLLVYLVRREQYATKSAKAYIEYLSAENEGQKQLLAAVHGVIETCAGGLDKRISEHVEIEQAITTKAPSLLETEPGLKHWLNASGQFYKALREATTPTHS